MGLDPPQGPLAGHVRLARRTAPLLAVAVVAIAGLAVTGLEHALRGYRYHDVAALVRGLRTPALTYALLFTGAAYVSVAGYDVIALTYAGHRPPFRRVALGAFLSQAISQTLGFSVLSGGSVRWRYWSAWGIPRRAIAEALVFVGLAYGIGTLFVAGGALVLQPHARAAIAASPTALRGAGSAALIVVVAFLVLCARRQSPLQLGGTEIRLPSLRLALTQLCVSVVDWSLAAAVLFVLLPPSSLTFVAFLGAFVTAHAAGMLSHVPGGLGVFEATLVYLLAPAIPAPVLVASAVAYRVIFYLAPFAVAVSCIVVTELARRQRARRVAGYASRIARLLLPTAFATTTLIGGAVLLVSGATPAIPARISLLRDLFPLGLVELSHFLGSVAGAWLVIIAWGLQRRLDAAWLIACILLGVGIVTSLLKGLDWEEALVLTVALAALASSRRVFYRKAALLGESPSAAWLLAAVIVIAASTWLGTFAYRHVEYRDDLWWRMTPHADASRFLRATVGVVAVAAIAAFLRLVRHAAPRVPAATESDIARVRPLVAQARSVTPSLVLLGDKSVLVSDDGGAFLMYSVSGRSWIALGDPVGEPAQCRELAWRFKRMADEHGGWSVFYQVGAAALPLYIELGLSFLKIGEEARVPLRSFGANGGQHKWLRRAVRDVEGAGVRFEIVPAAAVPAILADLRLVSDEWLGRKASREKGFSLGRFDERYLRCFDVAVVRGENDGIVAFANVVRSGGGEELSVDLMRHVDRAPRGVMDFLFARLMDMGREEGFAWFNLGMAPLAGVEARRLAPLLTHAEAMLYLHGEHFYNFRGLRQYKAKFDPDWSPRFIAAPGGLALSRVLTNVAALVAGGLRGLVTR